jgi:hypothetical protein
MPGLPTMPRPRTLRKPPRMPLGLLVALAAVVLLGVVAIVWTLRGQPTPTTRSRPPSPPLPPTPEPTRRSNTPADTPAPSQSPSSPPPAPATMGTPPTPTTTTRPAQNLPASLSAADFRRSVGQIQRSLKSLPGLPGFEVGARVYIDGAGKATRVVPEGRQAGSSFSDCVVKLVRQTRFKKARKESVHTATFKL